MMQAPQEPESGYKIIIAVASDGSIGVGVENENAVNAMDTVDPQSAAPGDGMNPDEESQEMGAMQPAPNIKSALTMALDIFRANGASTNSTAMQSEFKSGFSGPSM